jgi:hypothetical protein
MEQIRRIEQMEQRLDRASAAVMELSAALDKMEAAADDLKLLDAYYGSEEWRNDLDADNAGLLPPTLKRGVLSEDGIWNMLADYRSLKERALLVLGEGGRP